MKPTPTPTWVDIDAIHANPTNPRIIREPKFKQLTQSIKDAPWMLELRPIVVNSAGTVLGGNMRLQACKAAGLKQVPVVTAEGLTADQEREFIIKDNVGFGEWDWELLANEWDATELQEWGLDLPEIIQKEPETQEDGYEMPDEINTDIKAGDLFVIGSHRLLCGDSTKAKDWEKIMDGKSADLVMTDPPYNVNYEGGTGLKIMNDQQSDEKFDAFLLDFFNNTKQNLKAGGALYVWSPPGSTETQFRNQFNKSGLLLKQCLVWVKSSFVMGRQDYQWQHESCLYGWKEGAAHYFTDERTKSTVIEDMIDIKKMSKDEMRALLEKVFSEKIPTTVLRAKKPTANKEHPTMKPILLLSPLIKNSSKMGWLVTDPFLGSGSTMVACHQLNRQCYGMELDPKYCQVIIDRMLKLDPSLTITKNGKPYTHEQEVKP